MGKKTTVLLIALLALAAVLTGVMTVTAEEGSPPPPPIVPGPIECIGLSKYDLNKDGKVDWQDFDTWVRRVHWGGDECKRDGPAAACPVWVDVNGDGWVSVADLDAMFLYMKWCSGPPRLTWPGR